MQQMSLKSPRSHSTSPNKMSSGEVRKRRKEQRGKGAESCEDESNSSSYSESCSQSDSTPESKSDEENGDSFEPAGEEPSQDSPFPDEVLQQNDSLK